MNRRGTSTLRALLATIPTLLPPGTAAAEYVAPPIMPVPTAWQGRAAAVVRVLDKLDAHVETLTLKAGETGSYKSLTVTARSCMDRPDGLPADAAAFLDVQDRHGDVQPFSGWTFAREPAIGVFESPIYGVQLASCDGELVAPAAPPLPLPVPPPGSLAADDIAPGAAPVATGSSVEVDTPMQAAPAQATPAQAAPATMPEDGDAVPTAPAALPAGGAAQPDPVYPEGPPAPPPPTPPAP